MTSPNPAERDALEMEIKYTALDENDLETARALFLSLTGEVLRERHFVTTIRYYDTENFDLFGTSRTTLRKMDECPPLFRPEMHVKTLGRVENGGVLVRDEYQFALPTDDFDLGVVTDPAARELLAPATGKKLAEIFRTVNARNDLRAVFNVNAKRAAVELCVEKTQYVDAATGKVLKTAYEIELELSHRHSARDLTHDEALALMRRLGGELAGKIAGMAPNPKSKAEIGFSFYGR